MSQVQAEGAKLRAYIKIGIVEGQVIIKYLRAIAERMSSDQGNKRDCVGYESLKPLSTSDY